MRHPRSVSPEVQAIPHDRGWKRGKRAPTGHSHVAHSRPPAKGQDRPILWYDYDRKPRLPVHSSIRAMNMMNMMIIMMIIMIFMTVTDSMIMYTSLPG